MTEQDRHAEMRRAKALGPQAVRLLEMQRSDQDMESQRRTAIGTMAHTPTVRGRLEEAEARVAKLEEAIRAAVYDLIGVTTREPVVINLKKALEEA